MRRSMIFSIIFASSIIVRLLFVSTCLFHFDSITLATAVENTIQTGELHQDHNYSKVNVLLNSLIGLFIKLDIETLLKLNNILLSSFAVALLFLVGSILVGERFGILSAAFLSLNPLFLSIGATFPINFSGALLFIMASYLLSARYMKEKKTADLMISAAFFSIALLIRLDYFFFAIPIIYSLKRSPKRILLYLGIVLLIISFKLPEFVNFTSGMMVAHKFTFGIENISYLIKVLLSIITQTGILLLVLSCIIDARFALWMLIPALYYSGLDMPTGTAPRYFIPVILPIILSIAYAFDRIFHRSRVLVSILACVLAISCIISIYPVLDFRQDHCSPKEFAGFINRTTEKDSTLVLYGDDEQLMQFYTDRGVIHYPVRSDKESRERFIEEVSSALDSSTVYMSETAFIQDYPASGLAVFRRINETFNITPVGNLLWENPHHSSVWSEKFTVSVIKLSKK